MPVTKTPSNVLAPPIEADQRAQALQLIEIGQIRAGESAEAAADIGRRRGCRYERKRTEKKDIGYRRFLRSSGIDRIGTSSDLAGFAASGKGSGCGVKPLPVHYQLSVVYQSCSGYPWYVGSARDGAAPAKASMLTSPSARTALVK